MTILEKFNRAVIEAIHGLPYDEAIKKEVEEEIDITRCTKCKKPFFGDIEPLCSCHNTKCYTDILTTYRHNPITIGRVMQALPANIGIDSSGTILLNGTESEDNWQLIKENGQEATSEDQGEETLLKLLELLN